MEEFKMLKIKKLLSAFCALAITVTALAGLTMAQAADEASFYTVLEKKNFSDSADYDGYTQYVLTLKAKSLNNLKEFTTSGIGANKKYTGAGAAMIQAAFTFDSSKVGMCDIQPLVSGGSFTKNVELGELLWTSTDITEYITSPDFDIAEIYFVSIADADWTPATEDYTANPISFNGNQKVDYMQYDGGKVTEGSTATYSVNTSTLNAVNGTYPATSESTTYAVTVTGGTADVTEAEEGRTVTVTANIPTGQEVDTVTANVEYVDNNNGTYTFIMLAEAVTFTITYKDIVKVFTKTVTPQADVYTGEGKLTPVKVFDCTVANSINNILKLTFAKDAKTMEKNLDIPEVGDADFSFTALMINGPEGLTLDITDVVE